MLPYVRPLLLGLALLGLMACSRIQPIAVVHQQVSTEAPAIQSAQALQPALLRALVRGRWTVEEVQPNQVLARIDLRDEQSASITVDYVDGRYDIRYRDSKELQYADGSIHKRYNSLVKKLDRLIVQEIRLAQDLSRIPQ